MSAQIHFCVSWCSCWWEYLEVVVRLYALWLAW
ncbi:MULTISPECIES: DUF4913 domain-containing protein [Streptomyces]|nr:DUF4913 domain-containing protein [Streptomyces glaucescens]